jgi:hypothetical protein
VKLITHLHLVPRSRMAELYLHVSLVFMALIKHRDNFNFMFTDWVMFRLFRPLEDHVGPSTVTVGALCVILLLGCILKFSFEFVLFPFVEHDISTVTWSLKFYYLNLKHAVLP